MTTPVPADGDIRVEWVPSINGVEVPADDRCYIRGPFQEIVPEDPSTWGIPEVVAWCQDCEWTEHPANGCKVMARGEPCDAHAGQPLEASLEIEEPICER